jgi:hypothetical protein
MDKHLHHLVCGKSEDEVDMLVAGPDGGLSLQRMRWRLPGDHVRRRWRR